MMGAEPNESIFLAFIGIIVDVRVGGNEIMAHDSTHGTILLAPEPI